MSYSTNAKGDTVIDLPLPPPSDLPATVYLVTAGEYSDFHIVDVYASEELADQACDIINSSTSRYSDYAGVEPWEINTEAPVTRTTYYVQYYPYLKGMPDAYSLTAYTRSYITRNDKPLPITFNASEDVHGQPFLTVQGDDDPEGVTKVFAEQAAKLLQHPEYAHLTIPDITWRAS